MSQLPDTLHEMLNVAIKDMEACIQAAETYCFNANVWHEPCEPELHDISRCQICVAGAVIAKTLGANLYTSYNPEDFEEEGVCAKLEALDHIRTGQFGTALAFMQLATGKQEHECFITAKQSMKLQQVYDENCEPYYDFGSNAEAQYLVEGFKKLASAMQEMGI